MNKKKNDSQNFSSRKREKEKNNYETKFSRNDLLYGIKPVLIAMQQKKRKLKRLFLKENYNSSDRLREIKKLAEKSGLPVSELSTLKLSAMCSNSVHQGVVLSCSFLPYSSLLDLPKISVGESPIIVALDQIEDPHNFGAILRTCGFYNVSALVVPRDHSPGLTATVSKVSAGVLEWFPVISVPNLARFLNQQKSKGLWVVGLEVNAKDSLVNITRDRPIILVLGNEGRGIRRLTKKHCDRLIKIPGNSEVSSLNVSNAAAVVLFHLSKSSQIT